MSVFDWADLLEGLLGTHLDHQDPLESARTLRQTSNPEERYDHFMATLGLALRYEARRLELPRADLFLLLLLEHLAHITGPEERRAAPKGALIVLQNLASSPDDIGTAAKLALEALQAGT